MSVNVGRPRTVRWRGQSVQTSIWKTPVEGSVPVAALNLRGDEQADLSVHGGRHKAVYAYPLEHYAYWREQLSRTDLPLGAFGENFTTEGLLENEIQIGDELRVGTARFIVTQPRMPCFKLGIRFGSQKMVKRFLGSGRSGFYLAVLNEGEVGAGDSIQIARRATGSATVSDAVALYTAKAPDRRLLQRMTKLDALPEGWKEHFRQRLTEP